MGVRVVPARPRDTTADAERVQVALFRAASVSRRLQSAFALSATVVGAARRALARSYPQASIRDRNLRFVAVHYGRQLADDLRADLERRDRAQPPAG